MTSDVSIQANYEKQAIKIGIITVALAIVANFIPALYLWLVVGIKLDITTILSIWSLAFVTFGIGWIVQPITYYSMMGVSGSYIGWICGSVADLRAPSATMAQKTAGVEPGTPQGDVMSTLGVTGSVFVSVSMVTIFTIIGSKVIPLLPTSVIESFTYILPAVFGAVFADMASKNIKLGIGTIVAAFLIVYLVAVSGIPSALSILFVVIAGMLTARVLFVTERNKQTREKA